MSFVTFFSVSTVGSGFGRRTSSRRAAADVGGVQLHEAGGGQLTEESETRVTNVELREFFSMFTLSPRSYFGSHELTLIPFPVVLRRRKSHRGTDRPRAGNSDSSRRLFHDPVRRLHRRRLHRGPHRRSTIGRERKKEKRPTRLVSRSCLCLI